MTVLNSSSLPTSTPAPHSNSPFAFSGRFGRLSYIAWLSFFNFAFLILSSTLSLTLGLFNLSTHSFQYDFNELVTRLDGLFFLLLSLIYIYCNIVIVARRFHDMNRSAWWMLLLFFPLLNIFIFLWLILGSGNQGLNDYGMQRISSTWEIILAWCMIILILLSIVGIASFISYIMGMNSMALPAPIVVTPQTTQYF